MFTNAPFKIESVLLYDHFKSIEPDDILQHLNYCLEPTGLTFNITQAAKNGSFTLLLGSGLHVLISQTHSPLGLEGFGPALTSPFTQLTFKNVDETVARHGEHIFISVGSGTPTPEVPDELLGSLDAPPTEQSYDEFKSKLAICQLLTSFFVERNRPKAIHWVQSDQLMTPDYFEILAQDAFPTPLFVHPSLFSSRAEVNGTQVIGLRTYGASHLIGQEIIFKEAPVPFTWMFTRTCNFVDMVRNRGNLIPDGESFGLDQTEIIRVKHRPPSAKEPNGEVELTLEYSQEFELGELPLPGEIISEPLEDTSDRELDPNDPIDRAILERLKKMN